jgi:glycosyltransferase involved in cell wall biosynthesis
MKIALVTNGGFDRSGREAVIPALLNLVARLARRHEVHVFALAQYPEPCTYPLLGATVHNLAALPAPRGYGTNHAGNGARANGHGPIASGRNGESVRAPDPGADADGGALLSTEDTRPDAIDPSASRTTKNGHPAKGRSSKGTNHTGNHAAIGAGWSIPGLRLLRAAPRLLRALRAAGPFDLLHAYMGVPAAAVAMVAARRLHLPFVVTFDGNELVALPEINYGLGLSYRGRFVRRLITRAADRITVSTLYMSMLARDHGLRAEVIPLGVDLSMVPTQGPAAEGPPWRLLHVAHINPVKDQSTLLQALALVRAQEPAVHLHIVGSDTLAGAVHAQCEILGLSGHVTFTGALPADEVWPYYARSHLLLLPSRHEAAGVAVLEAAACSLPTVGTDVGYVSEWALRGAARATRVGDAPALARAILDLLRDRAARRRMGEEARALSCFHNADWTATRFEELYHQVVKR